MILDGTRTLPAKALRHWIKELTFAWRYNPRTGPRACPYPQGEYDQWPRWDAQSWREWRDKFTDYRYPCVCTRGIIGAMCRRHPDPPLERVT